MLLSDEGELSGRGVCEGFERGHVGAIYFAGGKGIHMDTKTNLIGCHVFLVLRFCLQLLW